MADAVSPLYRILQAQAGLDQTRASTRHEDALAQARVQGTLLNQIAIDRQMRADEALQSGKFKNPASTPGGAGPDVLSTYDYTSPLIDAARSAQQGVEANRERMAIARHVGDAGQWGKASADMDNQQMEYRRVMESVVRDDERRVTQAAQTFQGAKTPDEVRAGLRYVADNLGPKKAQAIEQQLAQSLPGGLDNATEEQIVSAMKPVLGKITARGNQLRSEASLLAAKNTADRTRVYEKSVDERAARAQAGGSVESEKYDKLPQEEKDVIDFYASHQLAGDMSWRVGLGRRAQGSKLIEQVDRRAATLSKELGLDPGDIIANKAGTQALIKTVIDRQKFVGAANQFSRNMISQADLVEKRMQSAAIDGVPAISKWLQAGRTAILGDPEVSALDTVIKGLAREHQRIVTGVTSNAQLHVSAQDTADKLLNVAQTPAQMREVIGVMREEAENAIKAGKEELADLKNQIRGNVPTRKSAGTAAAPAAAPISALSLPPRDQLQVGKTYQTPKGPLVWDGNQFVRQ